MKNSKRFIVALSLAATLLLAANAFAAPSFVPQYSYYAAGSSAMFNTFGLAAGSNQIFAPNALCGTHRWSKKSTAGPPAIHISLVDPRAGVTAEDGNIWIVWDDAAAAPGPYLLLLDGGFHCWRSRLRRQRHAFVAFQPGWGCGR